MRVTEKERELLAFIGDFGRTHGHPPTWREICEGLGINTNAVGARIRGMRRKGLLLEHERISPRALTPAMPPYLAGMALVLVPARRDG